MSAFTDAIAMASHDAIDHLGETITINNNVFSAIFDDDEFTDETGRLRRTVITLRNEDAAYIQKGDLVVARGRNFKVSYVPGTADALLDIELKNA